MMARLVAASVGSTTIRYTESASNDAIHYFTPEGAGDLNLKIALTALTKGVWPECHASASGRTGPGRQWAGDDDIVPVDSQMGLHVSDQLGGSARVQTLHSRSRGTVCTPQLGGWPLPQRCA